MWKEFKPALRFVLLFVGLYFAGNIVYGIYIFSKGNSPDEITMEVAQQSSWVLNQLGYDVDHGANKTGPTVLIKSKGKTILSIYEGCNGINVFIVFAAFVIAFGGHLKKYFWFIPIGIVVLHASNLLRIVLLYWTAIDYYRYFYYVHKYIFTAAIYAVVFVLWMVWANKLNERKKDAPAK